MRKAILFLVPMFLFACDRQPVEPDITPTLAAASSEWLNWDFVYPEEGLDWGPVPCLPGAPTAIAFGSVGIREHLVAKPDGLVKDRWSNPYFSDDFHLEIAGDTWRIIFGNRHAIEYYDGDWVDGEFVSEGILATIGGISMMNFRSDATGAVLRTHAKWTFKWDADGNVLFERFWERCDVK